MKKIAVISDIHGNLHALNAVISDIYSRDIDEIWCLGDIVGYGAFPEECLEIVRENCAIILGGNHDLAAAGSIDIYDFNPEALQAIEWTAENISVESRDFLANLEPLKEINLKDRKIVLSHGSPSNPVWEYVFGVYEAHRVFYSLQERDATVSILGHSHIQFYIEEKEGVPEISVPEKTVLPEGKLAIINPGSVGQPRDYNPNAAYAILDESLQVEFVRVPYDAGSAAEAIISAGLPVFLASRLLRGY